MKFNVIEYPAWGAYNRLPVTGSNAEIIPFPRPMRTDLPEDARVQMNRMRREREIENVVHRLFPLSSL
jgi:hypothetical protein